MGNATRGSYRRNPHQQRTVTTSKQANQQKHKRESEESKGGTRGSFCLRLCVIHRPRVGRDTFEWNHHAHAHAISSNRTGAAIGINSPRGPRDAALPPRAPGAPHTRTSSSVSHITRPRGNWYVPTRLENECLHRLAGEGRGDNAGLSAECSASGFRLVFQFCGRCRVALSSRATRPPQPTKRREGAEGRGHTLASLREWINRRHHRSGLTM